MACEKIRHKIACSKLAEPMAEAAVYDGYSAHLGHVRCGLRRESRKQFAARLVGRVDAKSGICGGHSFIRMAGCGLSPG